MFTQRGISTDSKGGRVQGGRDVGFCSTKAPTAGSQRPRALAVALALCAAMAEAKPAMVQSREPVSNLGVGASSQRRTTQGCQRAQKFRTGDSLGGHTLSRVSVELSGGDDANDNGGGDDPAYRRLEMRLGYGFSAFGGRFMSTPGAGVGFSNGSRDCSLGWTLVRGDRSGGIGSLELALEATHHENDNTTPDADGAEHARCARPAGAENGSVAGGASAAHVAWPCRHGSNSGVRDNQGRRAREV